MITGDRKPLEKRLAAMKAEAASWIPSWKDLSTYIAPTRGFFEDQPNHGREIDHQIVMDGGPEQALETMAAGLTSGLTSPSRPWFKFGLSDPQLMKWGPVREWLDIARHSVLSIFDRSNFYGWVNSIYKEIGGFGTGCGIGLEDYRTVIRFRNFTIGEYWLGTGADGRVNAFGREYNMTVGQVVEQFGISNVSATVKSNYDNGKVDVWVKVSHLIEENASRKQGKLDYLNMPWRSCYWETGAAADRFLARRGFEDFPVVAPRWDLTTTANIYGRSPGWKALGDSKMLMKQQKDYLIALDKIVDPPVQADASVEGEVNTLPGGLNRSSANLPNAGVRPAYQINPDLKAILDGIQRTQQKIDRAFFVDLFNTIGQLEGSGRTALEIAARNQEKLLLLGPLLERLESELLDPTVDRTFNIALRGGAIPPPPRELDGMEIKTEYISMLAQAQKAVSIGSIQTTVSMAGNLAGVQPDILDVIDFDAAVSEVADATGAPAKIIRDEASIAKRRKARAQEKQQVENSQAAAAGVQGAKLLSETKLDQNSALDAVAGR